MVKYIYFRFGKPGDGKEDTYIVDILGYLSEKVKPFEFVRDQLKIFVSLENDIKNLEDISEASKEMDEYLTEEGISIDRVQGYLTWCQNLNTTPITPIQILWLDDMYLEKESFI